MIAAACLVAVAASGLPACSGSDTPSAASTASSTSTADVVQPAAPTTPQPEVRLPGTVPTTLTVTDLSPGSGRAAEVGSLVVLDYVGVRSSDGTEFDSSYGTGKPYSLVVGRGTVIAGWDQGLIGVKAGMRRQLDIPSDLAYGQTAQGAVIRPGDALTFVVDVYAVTAPEGPDAQPTLSTTPRPGVAAATSTDLRVGTGATWSPTKNTLGQVIVARADTGEILDSTWEQSPIALAQVVALFPDVARGLEGMRVGGRREIQLPAASLFGGQGDPDRGLPAGVDLLLVVDLEAVY